MSFLAKTPKLPPTAPAELQQASSYKEADPVPLGYGRDVFGSHWLCQPYNWRTAYGGQSRPEWQYCSIAAGYRTGPIDYIGKVFLDGKEIANFDYTFAGGEDYHDFVLNPSLALGAAWKLRVYRGSEAQTAHADLVAATGQDHPAYRGVVVAIWENIDLGQGVTSLPNLALELGKHTPAVGTYPAGDSHPYGVNPFAAIYGLCLESRGGLDLDPALLDATHWGDQAAALETTGIGTRSGDLVKCHPIFSQVKDAAAVLSEILAYVDGFLFEAGGQVRIGWFPNAAPVGALPEISEHDLDAKPSGGSFSDWNQGATSVVVIFKDWLRGYLEASAKFHVPANRETGFLSAPVRSDRPFIHDAAQAATMAAEQATGVAPDSGIHLSVLKSRAVRLDNSPLLPGDVFNWDYAPHSLDLPCRVVARRIRSGAAADLLQVTRERGAFPTPYVAPVDPRVPPTLADPGEVDPSHVRLWFLPTSLALSLNAAEPRQVAALVDRAHDGIIGAYLSLSPDGSSYDRVLDQRFFAAKCSVTNGGILSGASVVRVASTSVDFARLQARAPSAIGQVDDALVLLVGDELVSVGDVTVISAGVYDLEILRGRQGTVAVAHADGAAAWLFLRSELRAALHNEFYDVRDGSNVYDAGIATKYFKLALFTVDTVGLAKPDAGLTLQLPDITDDEIAAAGYAVVLSSYAHTVAADAAGNVVAGQLGAGSTAKTTVQVFRGGTALGAVASAPGLGQFAVSLGSHTSATATKEGDNATVRCDSMSADTALVAIVVNVAGLFNVAKTFTLTKAKAGTPGAPGSDGDDGDDGNDGLDGPGVPFRGPYDNTKAYYYVPGLRRDAVFYSGQFWATNNPGKNGLTTWDPPGTNADWISYGATYSAIATGLLLAEDATITRTLTIGTDGANHGIIQSANFVTSGGTAGWQLKDDGTLIANNGYFRGEVDVGTGDYRFHKPVASAATFGNTAAGHIAIENAAAGFARVSARYGGTLLGGMQVANVGGQLVGILDIWSSGGSTLFRIAGNTSSGAAAILTWAGDTNLYRETSNRLRTDDDFYVGGDILAGDDVVFSSSQRLRFDAAGSLIAYIQESYGINLWGDATHPVHLRNSSLVRGGSSGENYGTGNIHGFGLELNPSATLPNVLRCGTTGSKLIVNTQHGTLYIPYDTSP